MCISTPKVPPPLPPRQAPKMADPNSVRENAEAMQRRRFGMAATVLTGPGGLAPAATTGKSLLGQ